MNLKFTLKDPRRCDGCLCLKELHCKTTIDSFSNKEIVVIPFEADKWKCEYFGDILDNLIRPQKCIEENGE